MYRTHLSSLQNWLESEERKPLVIRGARQVGKTWLVRHLAEVTGCRLIEFNFEKHPELKDIFESNDAKRTLVHISAVVGYDVDVSRCILFLDEIQAVPELLAKLRWFSEDVPKLPVIAAGSLLEFVLQDHAFSMPVGRISYLHLEPLSFEEFLNAREKTQLVRFLSLHRVADSIPAMVHKELMNLFKEYIVVGGLPAAVYHWVAHGSLHEVNQIHQDLLATYRDDFNKYTKKEFVPRLRELMAAIPKMLGNKFIYSRINREVAGSVFKQSLSLLTLARVSHFVYNTASNSIPLASEVREKFFKVIFLDVGLVCTALGVRLQEIASVDSLHFTNQGGVSEQVVGQLIRTLEPYYIQPALYYWARVQGSASAEVDYVIQHQSRIVPIEVKSGSTGALKSLHQFMAAKKHSLAVRINGDFPSITNIQVKTSTGEPVSYRLLSIPFYLIGQLHRLLDGV